MCFFRFFRNIPGSVFPRCQCVYTHQAGRKQALQQNWQSSEKSQNFKEKHNFKWTPCKWPVIMIWFGNYHRGIHENMLVVHFSKSTNKVNFVACLFAHFLAIVVNNDIHNLKLSFIFLLVCSRTKNTKFIEFVRKVFAIKIVFR